MIYLTNDQIEYLNKMSREYKEEHGLSDNRELVEMVFEIDPETDTFKEVK